MNFALKEGALPPIRAHADDAGWDLRTPVDVAIHPLSSKVIDTGVSIDIPPRTHGLLESKSGLMAKGIVCPGGTIDSGYTGTIRVVLENHTGAPYYFKAGDKIVQIVFIPILDTELEQVDNLNYKKTERAENGFGSSGK